MNIFAVSSDTRICAEVLDDVRLRKMILETGQIISTVIKVRGEISGLKVPPNLHKLLYKPTHSNHPVVIWAGRTHANFRWTVALFKDMGEEYASRFGKSHETSVRFQPIVEFFLGRNKFDPGSITPFANCTTMKNIPDPTDAYSCYMVEKWFNDSSKGEAPIWTRASVPEIYREAGGIIRLPRSRYSLPTVKRRSR